jgi:cell division protein FtsZ
MADGGVTMMLYGESDRGAEEVVHEALNHPLLDVDVTGASGALVHVTGGRYMTLDEANQVVRLLTSRIKEDANVIIGARQDPAFGDTIKVMAIFTGVGGDEVREPKVEIDQLAKALSLRPNAARQNQSSHAETAARDFHRFE